VRADFLIRIDQSTDEFVRYTSDLTTGGSVEAGGDVRLTAGDDATLLRLRPET